MHPEGSSAPAASAALNVPGLSVKDSSHDTKPSLLTPFSPTSRENLTAAVHEKSPAFPSAPLDRGAAIVSQSPDPRLSGRVVYSLAIQMPNVTSFSGSWMVWFAEREVLPLGPGAPPPVVHAPVPVRKVDPKYIAAAASERVQGMVRLFGVIRKDGHVDSIALLHHLDVRLDSSAAEALAKWEFTPAQRNGSPVDVDAVFEIPFHLAPLPAAHSKK
jgi:TonB family protein